MTARSYPDQLRIDIPDEQALSEGRAAARRHNRGAPLADQLRIGIALTSLARTAMREAGTNQRSGRPFNTAFSRLLAGERDLSNVTNNTRAAALWCIENWPDVQPYLERLRTEDPHRFQVIGVRGLRDAVERELLTRHVPDEVEMPEPREPAPRRRTPAEQLNMLLLAVQAAGMRYDEDASLLLITNPASHRAWQERLRDMAAEVAALSAEELAALMEDEQPNDQAAPDANPDDQDGPF